MLIRQAGLEQETVCFLSASLSVMWHKRIHIARVLKACLALEYDAGSRWLVNQLLSSWETPVEALGPTARFSVWVPAEAICLGRKTPHRCMLHAATACSNARQHFQR